MKYVEVNLAFQQVVYTFGRDRLKEDPMELIDQTAEGATIHLDKGELHVAMALIQEGRSASNHHRLTGQALEELFRTAAWLVQAAKRTDKPL